MGVHDPKTMPRWGMVCRRRGGDETDQGGAGEEEKQDDPDNYAPSWALTLRTPAVRPIVDLQTVRPAAITTACKSQ